MALLSKLKRRATSFFFLHVVVFAFHKVFIDSIDLIGVDEGLPNGVLFVLVVSCYTVQVD